jgi:hypothetical protein
MKEYNRLYLWKSLCVQVLLVRGYKCIHLLPQISLAINNGSLYFGLGFEWFVGTINIGYACPAFIEREIQRLIHAKECADKLGLTIKQERLRWNL